MTGGAEDTAHHQSQPVTDTFPTPGLPCLPTAMPVREGEQKVRLGDGNGKSLAVLDRTLGPHLISPPSLSADHVMG